MRIEYVKLEEITREPGKCNSFTALIDRAIYESSSRNTHKAGTCINAIIMPSVLFDVLNEDVQCKSPRHTSLGGTSPIAAGVYNGCYLFLSGIGPGEYDTHNGYESLLCYNWPLNMNWLVIKLTNKEHEAANAEFAKRLFDHECKRIETPPPLEKVIDKILDVYPDIKGTQLEKELRAFRESLGVVKQS